METEQKPKRKKEFMETKSETWEPKVGAICIYWMQLGTKLHGYPAIITNPTFNREGLWDMVRFQPVNLKSSVAVYGAEFSDIPMEGKFTQPE